MSAAPASPAAARHPHWPKRFTLALRPRPETEALVGQLGASLRGSRLALIRLGQRDSRRAGPQAIEVVERTHRDLEHVDDDVAVVQERPLTALDALGGEDVDAEAREMVSHALGNRLHLGVGSAAADHEVVRDGRELRGLQHDQVVRLPFERGARALERAVPAGERHQAEVPSARYSSCRAMYASTAAGTRKRTERPAATRARMAVAEMSRPVMCSKLTPRPDAWWIVPLAASYRNAPPPAMQRSPGERPGGQGGRIITTSSHRERIASGSRQVWNSSKASFPRMKAIRLSGPSSARSARIVSME